MAVTDDAVGELVALVRTAVAETGPWVAAIGPAAAAVPVALGGRLLAGGPLRRRLDEALGRLDGVAPRSAAGSPLDGALLLGQADEPGRYRGLVHVERAA